MTHSALKMNGSAVTGYAFLYQNVVMDILIVMIIQMNLIVASIFLFYMNIYSVIVVTEIVVTYGNNLDLF